MFSNILRQWCLSSYSRHNNFHYHISLTFCERSGRIRRKRCRLGPTTSTSPWTPSAPARSFRTVTVRLFGTVWPRSCAALRSRSVARTSKPRPRFPDCIWIRQTYWTQNNQSCTADVWRDTNLLTMAIDIKSPDPSGCCWSYSRIPSSEKLLNSISKLNRWYAFNFFNFTYEWPLNAADLCSEN